MSNIIVYSKNRPMQLEACLRSMRASIKEYNRCKVTVIFKATEKEFIETYRTLFGLYTEVKFVQETVFKHDTLNAIDQNNKFTMFVMDDLFFKNEFSFEDDPFQIMNHYGYGHVLAVSLRLHKGIKYCYALDKNLTIPNFIRDVPDKACVWSYPNKDGDWGYGYSLDANVFFTNYITSCLERIEFTNPNTLEAALNQHFTVGHVPHYLICYPDKAKIINIPVNRVQNTYQNRYEETYTEQELNERFKNGEIISLENISNIDTNAVHYPLEFKFEKVP